MNLSFPCLKRSGDLPAEQIQLARFMRDLQEEPLMPIYGIGNGSNQDGASWEK